MLLILVMGYVTYAQEKSTKLTVTEFEITSENLQELQEIDWNSMSEVFEGNKPTDSIRISVAYKNQEEQQLGKAYIKDFKFMVSGITKDQKTLVNTLRNLISTTTNFSHKN